MISFKEFIAESGDSEYPYKYNGIEHGIVHQYEIQHPSGKKFGVSIFHGMPKNDASIEFGDKSKRVGDDVHLTHEHPRDAHKILSTVHKIMKNHGYEHGIDNYHFTSDGKEKSRVSLYRRFTKKLGGTTQGSNYQDRVTFRHKIPVDNL